MRKNTLISTAYGLLLLIICSTGQVLAQKPGRLGPAPVEEIRKAREAVDADMNSLAKHKAYIYAMGLSNPLVIEQYREWLKKYPDNFTVPLAMGTVYYGAEMPGGREFLERAAEMQPTNAKIWYMLSLDALWRGQRDLSIEYSKKASLVDPSNADYAANYLSLSKNTDPDYKSRVIDFVKRFPKSERGAQILYGVALDATTITDKIYCYEELRRVYPPQNFNWSASGMPALADLYLQTDPEKALVLTSEMDQGKDWKLRKQAAELLIQANVLERERNYRMALSTLELIVLPKFNYISEFIAIKKAALLDNMGNSKMAYDSLAVKFATLPSDKLYTALEWYGKKLDKSKEQIAKDIETLRNTTAVTAYPFELGLYTSKGKLSLASLKGKVVLLTFWFPACGPCREEFPDFEAVMKKFKGKEVVYAGINVLPEQDPYVLPMMKNANISFIPLRGTAEFAEKYYGVLGEPQNFLIDKNGKIIFKGFRVNNNNHRTLELMISSLLEKN